MLVGCPRQACFIPNWRETSYPSLLLSLRLQHHLGCMNFKMFLKPLSSLAIRQHSINEQRGQKGDVCLRISSFRNSSRALPKAVKIIYCMSMRQEITSTFQRLPMHCDGNNPLFGTLPPSPPTPTHRLEAQGLRWDPRVAALIWTARILERAWLSGSLRLD